MQPLSKQFHLHNPIHQRVLLTARYAAMGSVDTLLQLGKDLNKLTEREKADASPNDIPKYHSAKDLIRNYGGELPSTPRRPSRSK